MGNYMSVKSRSPTVSWKILKQEIVELGEDFEVEHYDAEASSRKVKTKRCPKAAGHAKMIPVWEFKMDHLPPPWRRLDVYELILAQAAQTVKINVPFVSLDRPDDYPCWTQRGQWYQSTGTGRAYIDIDSQVLNKKPIPCPIAGCKAKPGKHLVTPVFDVATAKHVVFDKSEAENATVEIFYDKEGSTSVITADVIDVTFSGRWEDECTLMCVSHDLDLFVKYLMIRIALILWCYFIMGPRRSAPPSRERKSPLVVISAHPHGWPKKMSLGEWVGYGQPQISHGMTTIRESLDDIKSRWPSWEHEGASSSSPGEDFIHVSPQILQDLEKLVHDRPNMTWEEYEQRVHPTISKDKSLSSITYTAATCPGSSGAPVLVYLGAPDGDWDEGMRAYHFRGYTRRNKRYINASGHVDANAAYVGVMDREMKTLHKENDKKLLKKK